MFIQAAMPYIPLQSNLFQAIITSSPYYGLRAYNIPSTVWDANPDCEHQWDTFVKKGTTGGTNSSKLNIKNVDNFQIVTDQNQSHCKKCGAWRGQHGSEPTLDLYIKHEVQIFREVKRVLRDDGVLWINIGDSYNGSGGAGGDYSPGGLRDGQPKYKPHNQSNMKPKDLMGVPWALAFALRDDGWYLRSEVIWHKTNGMPESASDRPSRSHENIFLLTKSSRYYWNKDYKEPLSEATIKDGRTKRGTRGTEGVCSAVSGNCGFDPEGRRIRTVWTIPTQPYSGAHFATFPPDLAKKCIMCSTQEGDWVFDPFVGSGTTVMVANRLNRVGIGTDLGWGYLLQAQVRTGQKALEEWVKGAKGDTVLDDLPLFGGVN